MNDLPSEIAISDIVVRIRMRKDLGDLTGLASSIREVGLFHPVVVNEHNELIAGLRRLEACKRILGWQRIPVTIINLAKLSKGEFAENVFRKSFTTSELVAIKRVLEPEVKVEAEKRKGLRTDLGKQPSGNFPAGDTRDIVGSFGGVSGKTLEKAEAVVEAAEENPEKYGKLLEKVDEGTTSVSYAYTMVKRGEKHANPPALPSGVFGIVYADPPWDYDVKLRGSPDYPTMPTAQISALKIPVGDNAILFLWATNPKLEDALQVMNDWGFTYKTNMVWVKDKIGTGYYFRGQHELLLLGVKGDMPTPMEDSRPSSVLVSARREHSEKPEEIYELIEKMYPNRTYLELFACKKRGKWVSWGQNLEQS